MTDRTEVSGVSFDEDQGFDPIPEPELEPPIFGDVMIKTGIVANPGDVSIVLGVLAVVLIAGSFYILASSIPQPPALGGDVLRAGEAVPGYIPSP